MNGPFQVAQAGGISTSNTTATPVRIYKLTKPLTDQAVMVNLGYDQKVKDRLFCNCQRKNHTHSHRRKADHPVR